MKKIILVIMVCTISILNARPWTDDASNYSDWTNGSNMGAGFGNWDLWEEASASNDAGHFLGNSSLNFADINTSGKAFGMYGHTGKTAFAQRFFTSTLAEGSTFKIELAINWRNGLKGIDIINSGYVKLFKFYVTGDKYYIDFNNSPIELAWAYSSTSKFVVECTQGNGKINVRITRNLDVYNSGDITTANIIAGFLLYVGGTSGIDDQNNLYFNSMEIRTDSPVPVELSSFTAAIQNKAVVLNWATATEINNYGFEVEKSFDKVNWNKIAFKNGYGNSNSVKDYTYTDNDITKNGIYYYRLKQIDNNGSFEYSNTVEVSVNIPIKFEVSQNYPNPFNPVTNISFNLPEANNVTLYIFNAIGQQIKTINAGYKEAGKHTIEFDGSNLNSGVYFYKVEAGNNSMIRKMALIK